MWKALSILSLFCIFMRMCTSGQKRTMRFDTGENFYTCIYFSILFLYVSLDRKKCEWNYVGSLNEVVIARKSKHTHLKYVFLRKKNFKISLLFPKEINIRLCRKNAIVKIKLFIFVVLSNALPAPRKRTISTDTLENKK